MALITSKNNTPLVNTFEESLNLKDLQAIRDKYAEPTKQAAKPDKKSAEIYIPSDEEKSQDVDLAELQRFFYDSSENSGLPEKVLPVALHALRDLSYSRYGFPILIDEHDTDNWLTSLSGFFDKQLEKKEDQAHRSELLKIEFAMRRQLAGGPSAKADELYKNALEKHELQAADEAPKGTLYGYTPELYRAIFKSAAKVHMQKRQEQLRIQAKSVRDALERMLGNGEGQSTEGTMPESEIDLDAFTQFQNQAGASKALSTEQRQRLEGFLEIISSWYQQNLEGYTPVFENNLSAAVKKQKEIKSNYLAFIKALRRAQLEAKGLYDTQKHDGYFADFSEAHLSEEEWRTLPAVFYLANQKLPQHMEQLHDIITAGLNIKIILPLDSILEYSGEALHFSAAALLAGQMLTQTAIYSCQFPLAFAAHMRQPIMDGLSFSGPALFSVYGAFGDDEKVDPYLVSAAAADARCFIPFVHNPDAGNGLAETLRILALNEPEKSWPQITFNPRGKDEPQQQAFTSADFLALLPRATKHFTLAPCSENQKSIQSVDAFVEAQPGKRVLPGLQMALEDGALVCAAADRHVAAFSLHVARQWAQIQELAGISGSHLAQKGKQLREELEQQLHEAHREQQQKHDAEMQQAIQQVSDDVIEKIAAGLLAEDWNKPSSASIGQKPAAVESERAQKEPQEAVAEQQVAPAEDDDDDDIEISHEPYIDTPLCTSCNECININKNMFSYDDNQQAFIADAKAGTYLQLVTAAEKCPVHIIHPGKPLDESEENLDELIKRAEKYN